MKKNFTSVLMFGLMMQGMNLVAGPAGSKFAGKISGISTTKIVAITTTAICVYGLGCKVKSNRSQDEFANKPQFDHVEKSLLELQDEVALEFSYSCLDDLRKMTYDNMYYSRAMYEVDRSTHLSGKSDFDQKQSVGDSDKI